MPFFYYLFIYGLSSGISGASVLVSVRPPCPPSDPSRDQASYSSLDITNHTLGYALYTVRLLLYSGSFIHYSLFIVIQSRDETKVEDCCKSS